MDDRKRLALAFASGGAIASFACFLGSKWSTSQARSRELVRGGRSSDLFVGIDLGGTTVACALVDNDGNIKAQNTAPLCKDKGFEAVVQFIAGRVMELIGTVNVHMADITAIGVGAPGNLDCTNGVVVSAANFDWKNAPITSAIEGILGRPTFLENDANAAVLAEKWIGAGRGSHVRHMIMFTLGTGIGAGVISDNVLIRGSTGMAGELGHTIIDPYVGRENQGRLCSGTGVRGVLEQYASARAIGVLAKEAVSKPGCEPTTLASVTDLTARDVFEHAAVGDELAKRLVDRTADYIAVGFINGCRAFDPQLIVVAGGLAEAGDALLEPVRRHFLRRWWSIQPSSTCKIVRATVGNSAGVVGAAAAARIRNSALD
eukprot:TRINITY_DN16061_c0_g1_i1.p1 TRINITY_DN16061_c0_g1~~TRINITY_DN16061_c0_g1_i1.p1  ORF type:complete len:374 (-),score=38.79 TRINITY_DN16061_c0_g1_i1:87-1208(-)